MVDFLIDSSVLIEALRGNPRAVQLLDTPSYTQRAAIHAFCQAEIIVGARNNRELNLFARFLKQFSLLHPSEADSNEALRLLSQLHLAQKVGFADCLIAATAKRLGLTVVTLNDRHFRRFADLDVARPF